MFYEISRRSINVNKIDKINLSWDDSIITIRINKYLHMLELTTNLHSLEKKIDFNESVIACSTNSPLPENFIRQYVSKPIRNSELLEMMTDPALWPHSKQITNEMTDIVQFDWLPQELIFQSERLLSILNSVGNIELYVQKRLKFDCILNVSQLMNEYLHNDHYNEEQSEFLNFKQFAYNIEPSAMCWSPNSNSDNSCYFVTAMRSGRLILWLLKFDTEFSVQYCGGIEPYNVIIPKIAWIPLQDTFLLVTSDELGQIVGHQCSIENNTIKKKLKKEMWPHIDKMLPKSFHYYLHNNNIIVMYDKYRHLIVQMFDKNIKLLSQHIELVNDFKIVCLAENDKFYLCTDNVKMYTIDICIDEQNLNVKLNEIIIKDTYPEHELCSLAISKNKAMYALAMVDQKVQHRKLQLQVHVVLMCSQTEFDPHISRILNNPTKSLTKVWDHIEVLRLKTLKKKQLPKIDYKSLLNEGQSDVYKLKIYYVLLAFHLNLLKYVVRNPKELLPELSVEKIKDQIQTFHAVKILKNLHEKQNDGNLSDFDQKYFDGSKRYLKYYCDKYAKCVTDLIPQNILDCVTTDIKYTCQCCDEEIIGLTCKYNHLNMFCSVTFTPIEEDDYLVCKACGITAAYHLHTQKPSCVLCDRYLSNSL